MTKAIETNLGELISVLYTEYLELYGDEELASVAAAATINELMFEQSANRADLGEAAAA